MSRPSQNCMCPKTQLKMVKLRRFFLSLTHPFLSGEPGLHAQWEEAGIRDSASSISFPQLESPLILVKHLCFPVGGLHTPQPSSCLGCFGGATVISQHGCQQGPESSLVLWFPTGRERPSGNFQSLALTRIPASLASVSFFAKDLCLEVFPYPSPFLGTPAPGFSDRWGSSWIPSTPLVKASRSSIIAMHRNVNFHYD